MKNTKQIILQNALSLFSRKGFDAVSVADIAEISNLTKGALYKHFKNKDDILNHLLSEINSRYLNAFTEFLNCNIKYENKDLLISDLCKYLSSFLTFWTNDNNNLQFLHLLTVLQFSAQEYSKIYKNLLVEKPIEIINSITDNARNLKRQNTNNSTESEINVSEVLYSYVYFEICNYNPNKNLNFGEKITNHISDIINTYYENTKPKSLLQRANQHI